MSGFLAKVQLSISCWSDCQQSLYYKFEFVAGNYAEQHPLPSPHVAALKLSLKLSRSFKYPFYEILVTLPNFIWAYRIKIEIVTMCHIITIMISCDKRTIGYALLGS